MSKPFKLPKTLGACADLIFSTRARRLALQKEVDALQAQETALKEHFIATVPKSDAAGVTGRLARVTVGTKDIPTVKDWEAFHKYVKKSGRFDLLQRRLSTEAVTEMLEAGEKLPGVEVFHAKVVSINKV